MLFTTLMPLIARMSLTIDLQDAGQGRLSLTIIPRPAETGKPEKTGGNTADMRPILLTGTAAELDAEFEKGDAGALAQLISQRRSLGDQIAAELEAEKKAAAERADSAQKAREKRAAEQKNDSSAPKPTPTRVAKESAPEESDTDDDAADETETGSGPASLF